MDDPDVAPTWPRPVKSSESNCPHCKSTVQVVRIIVEKTGRQAAYRVFSCGRCGHMHWRMVLD